MLSIFGFGGQWSKRVRVHRPVTFAGLETARATYAQQAAELKQVREDFDRQAQYLKEGLVRRDRVDDTLSASRRDGLLQPDGARLARMVEPGGSLREDLAMDPGMLVVPMSVPAAAELLSSALMHRPDLEVIGGTCKEFDLELSM